MEVKDKALEPGWPFARTGDCMRVNSVATISKEEVQALYEEFSQALKSGDLTSLERI
jgi:hypothetical protein